MAKKDVSPSQDKTTDLLMMHPTLVGGQGSDDLKTLFLRLNLAYQNLLQAEALLLTAQSTQKKSKELDQCCQNVEKAIKILGDRMPDIMRET